MKNFNIPVYVIDNEKEEDTRNALIMQFEEKSEFSLNFFPQKQTHNYEKWRCLQDIVKLSIKNDDSIFILCDIEHQFTQLYNSEILKEKIVDTYELGGKILIGGLLEVGSNLLYLSKGLFWLDFYSDFSFIIVYNSIYKDILNTNISNNQSLSAELNSLTSNKFLIYPTISKKKFLDIKSQDLNLETDRRLIKMKEKYIAFNI